MTALQFGWQVLGFVAADVLFAEPETIVAQVELAGAFLCVTGCARLPSRAYPSRTLQLIGGVR